MKSVPRHYVPESKWVKSTLDECLLMGDPIALFDKIIESLITCYGSVAENHQNQPSQTGDFEREAEMEIENGIRK